MIQLQVSLQRLLRFIVCCLLLFSGKPDPKTDDATVRLFVFGSGAWLLRRSRGRFGRGGRRLRRYTSSWLRGRRHLRRRTRHARRWGRFGCCETTVRALLIGYRVLCAALWTFHFRNESTVWADRLRVFHCFTLRAGCAPWLELSATHSTNGCYRLIDLTAFVAFIQLCFCRSKTHT